MITDSWKYLFRDVILWRGEEYYEDGAVDQIQKTDHGWKAIVHGSEDYEVEITEENGSIKAMQCTCPYAEDGSYCKHEAALLFELSEEDDLIDEESSEDVQTLDEMIDAMREEDLREEMKRIVSEDRHIRDRIYSRYRTGKAGRKEVNRIHHMLADLAMEYGDRYGFIDWRSGFGYADAFTACLKDAIPPLLDNGDYMIAFEALEKAFYVLNTVEMDGSGGEHGMIADEIAGWWTQAIHLASEEEREKMHQRLEELNENSSHMICSDTIEGVLENAFDDPKYLNALLEDVRNKLSNPSLSDYEIRTNLKKYRNFLERSGNDTGELEQWLNEHADLTEVKQYRYEQAVIENDIPEQIRLLEELIEPDEDTWRLRDWRKKLLELVRKAGDTGKEKELLTKILMQQNAESKEYLQRLRSLSDGKTWPSTRDRYLSNHPSLKAEIYYEEKEYRKLMDTLKDSPVNETDKYLPVLKDRYPKEVRKIYMNHLHRLIQRSPGSYLYNEMEKYLQTAASLEGGRKEVLALCDQWIETYPSRKAMIRMLQRVKKNASA